jgi:pSer/pThr/pTyr-binding forkhead associated (FHA) protein
MQELETVAEVGTTTSFDAPTLAGEPKADEQTHWLTQARASITEPGEYLVYDEDGEVSIFPLTEEWTRIGRSLAADINFDDPTVSRRHALVVRQPDGMRVLDDRSLNGVYVNEARIEWGMLADGDRIAVGRHTLHFVVV